MSRGIALSLLLTAAAGLAAAQEPQHGKIVILNFQNAVLGTKLGQKGFADLEAKFTLKRDGIAAKQKEIESLRDRWNKAAGTLSLTARQSLYRTIQEKSKSLERDAEDLESLWNLDQQQLLEQLGQKLLPVINQYAKDHAIALVLDAGSGQTPVFWAMKTLDITKDLIECCDRAWATEPKK